MRATSDTWEEEGGSDGQANVGIPERDKHEGRVLGVQNLADKSQAENCVYENPDGPATSGQASGGTSMLQRCSLGVH